MSFHRPTMRELAIHEAGHAYAYAALVSYKEPFEMGLGRNDEGDHGWCSRNTLLHREVRLARVPADVRVWTEWQACAEVIIAIAGPVAEFRRRHGSRESGTRVILANAERFLRPGTFDTDGDFERIRSTLDYIEPQDPLATFERLIGVCDSITAANWEAIKLLAKHLFEHRLLNENALMEWFAEHPAKAYREPLAV